MVAMRHRVRFRLLVAVGLAGLSVAQPSVAQPIQRLQYDLPTDDLAHALRAVSRLSGREIIFNAEAVAGRRSPRLIGLYSADEAVQRLLRGSGLDARFKRDVVIIRGRSDAPAEIDEQLAGADEIIVTGSRIRGSKSASPTIIRSRDAAQEEGMTNLGMLTRSLTQNFTGGQNPGVIGNQGQSENANGSSTINLRGLGPDATLTLINGHRSAYDAIAQGVDISTIPLAAIERVEVVTDGASALYGSDAVAGVANVILRRDFKGVETSARIAGATSGGDFEQQYSAVGGHVWGNGGIVATVEYIDASPITARQRRFTGQMHPDATLYTGQDQVNAVLAGHQLLSDGLTFEFDGQYTSRRSDTCNPSLATSSCRVNGTFIHRAVESYSASPSLTARLPADWLLRLGGTIGASTTDITTQSYSLGNLNSTARPHYRNSLKSAEVGIEGKLWDGPAGPVRVAFGGGYRSVKLQVDSRRATASATTTIFLFDQSRNTSFGYGELNLPLFGPQNSKPLLRELSVSAAARREDNSGFGQLTTPKVGLVYKPFSGITFRSSWGRSFKAPTLFQTGQPPQGFLIRGSTFRPTSPNNGPVLFISGGRQALAAEKAETWTAGLSLTPKFVPGLTIDLNYFGVRYRDRVVSPVVNLVGALGPDYASLVTMLPSAASVVSTIDMLTGGFTNQTGAPFDATAVTAIVDNSLRNAARQKIRGFDVAMSYARQLSDVDAINLAASLSYLESSQTLLQGQSATELAGMIFNPPHWRARAKAGAAHGPVSYNLIVNYVGGTTDNRFAPFVQVSDFISVDANLQLTEPIATGWLSGVSLALSAQNLFNEPPSAIRTTNAAATPFDSTNYPAVGRVIGLTITKKW